MSTLLVTLGGLVAIAAIVWWFWMSTPAAAHASTDKSIEIRVEGGAYQPAVITALAGQPLTLRFLRLDASPCAEQVIFAGLDISAELPIGHGIDVKLPELPAGSYEFTCQMGMYRGKVVVQQ